MPAPLRYTLLALLLAAALALTPLRPLKVSGSSMEPTLSNGETLLLDQLYWRPGGLRRDDVVVVQHGPEVWVKRLVGLPGDTLQITREGRWIARIENLTVDPSLARPDEDLEIRRVGAGEIFVIGDNLNRSVDSLTQEAGAFRLKDVIGIARRFNFSRRFPFRGGEQAAAARRPADGRGE